MPADLPPPATGSVPDGGELAALRAETARLGADNERLRLENQLLRQRIDTILRRLFDKKGESLDAAQLELLLDPDAAKKAPAVGGPAGPPAAEQPAAPAGRREPRKPRDWSHLEVRETVLEREEVRANPAAFREIDRVVSERLDYRPASIFVQRVVRVVHVPLDDPDGVPLKVPAPPSLGLSATPRLVSHVLCSKYAHSRPHYRTQGILRQRHAVELARNTLCNWDRVAADTCEPVYQLIHSGLLARHLLQADETPVHYLDPGAGKCGNGFFWVLHAPRDCGKGDILFQWHPNRRAACLDSLLGDWRGLLQTDAYAAYDSWAADKPGVTLAACWAHARRKFHEAFKAGQTLAAGPLAAIQRLYQVETTLRRSRAGPGERRCLRQQSALPLLNVLKSDLVALRQRPDVLPRSPLGAAIDYTLGLWDRLSLYSGDGRLPIDNNWIENGIRPTAVGKRNWLFVGGETTGQRAAVLFTLVECARRAGHDPELYLTDLLERLPAMTNQDDLSVLLPARWRPEAAVATLHS